MDRGCAGAVRWGGAAGVASGVASGWQRCAPRGYQQKGAGGNRKQICRDAKQQQRVAGQCLMETVITRNPPADAHDSRLARSPPAQARCWPAAVPLRADFWGYFFVAQ